MKRGLLQSLLGLLLLFAGVGSGFADPAYFWANFAGQPEGSGSTDGAVSVARFYNPRGVAMDGSGNLYVADTYNYTIRKISSSGVVTTLAGTAGQQGSTDGTGSAARFGMPASVAVDGSGNVYVADTVYGTIRKISSAGVVTTLAGSAAGLVDPWGLAVDGSGNIYVADCQGAAIRKISSGGVVTTLAGGAGQSGYADGTGSAALFYEPRGVAVDGSGNVYVADTGNDAIRKISSGGVVTTLAGKGGQPGYLDATGGAARFSLPEGVAVDGNGNVYVAESDNSTIRKISSGGVVTTLAGSAQQVGSTDGTGSAARFGDPFGLMVDGSGNVYVADTYNNTIRKIDGGGVVTTVAGNAGQPGSTDGTGSAAQFREPQGVAVDGSGNLYVADTYNSTIRKISSAGVVTTLAGTATGYGGHTDGTGSAAQFYEPSGVAVDGSGNVYVADTYNYTIRKISSGGAVTTLAGSAGQYGSTDGTGSAARFNSPYGVAADGNGNVYVADTGNSTIRKISSGGVVTTLAGSAGQQGSTDGTGSAARFDNPRGVAVDGSGNIYVAEAFNQTIRKISSSGVVTTLAGSAGQSGSTDGMGSAAQFYAPSGVAADGSGNVYVADTSNDTIRKISSGGVVTTIGGRPGAIGAADGVGAAAAFSHPWGIAVSGSGTLWIADTGNSRISQGTPVPLPIVTLVVASNLTSTGVTLNGTVNPNGFATTAQLAYGLDTTYGSTASITLSPNNGASAQNVSAALTGLTPGTTYHYCLTATNPSGTVSTIDGTFTTLTATALQTWRQTYYGMMDNNGNAADTADPYLTGLTNLSVFAFFGQNQDPAQAQISLLPQPQMSGGNLCYSFTQPAGVSGITYCAEWSKTLQSTDWHAISDTGSGSQHVFSVPMGSNSQLFIRLKVTEP